MERERFWEVQAGKCTQGRCNCYSVSEKDGLKSGGIHSGCTKASRSD